MICQFFRERIEIQKLTGPVELEPDVPGLPDGTYVDLILRRHPKQSVAVVILEKGLKPNSRVA